MPTVIIYDASLSEGLPDWVRFGTAFRGIEHACGAVTHPKANDDIRKQVFLMSLLVIYHVSTLLNHRLIRKQALEGLTILHDNLKLLLKNPECKTAQSNLYVGGFMAIRALNTGCYPALGHLIKNHYSARFDVHQGSCSGIMCARLMHYHKVESAEYQSRISAALGDADIPASRLVRDLAAILPGVSVNHSDAGVTDEMLKEFSQWEFENNLARINQLSPKKLESADDIYAMLSEPLENL